MVTGKYLARSQFWTLPHGITLSKMLHWFTHSFKRVKCHYVASFFTFCQFVWLWAGPLAALGSILSHINKRCLTHLTTLIGIRLKDITPFENSAIQKGFIIKDESSLPEMLNDLPKATTPRNLKGRFFSSKIQLWAFFYYTILLPSPPTTL